MCIFIHSLSRLGVPKPLQESIDSDTQHLVHRKEEAGQSEYGYYIVANQSLTGNIKTLDERFVQVECYKPLLKYQPSPNETMGKMKEDSLQFLMKHRLLENSSRKSKVIIQQTKPPPENVLLST